MNWAGGLLALGGGVRKIYARTRRRAIYCSAWISDNLRQRIGRSMRWSDMQHRRQCAKCKLVPIIAALGILGVTDVPARSQTNAPRPPQTATPFGTDWAKPNPNPSGYIYDDPRLRNQRRLPPEGRITSCPAGRMYDPVNQTCR
jgi:hypothetical protein